MFTCFINISTFTIMNILTSQMHQFLNATSDNLRVITEITYNNGNPTHIIRRYFEHTDSEFDKIYETILNSQKSNLVSRVINKNNIWITLYIGSSTQCKFTTFIPMFFENNHNGKLYSRKILFHYEMKLHNDCMTFAISGNTTTEITRKAIPNSNECVLVTYTSRYTFNDSGDILIFTDIKKIIIQEAEPPFTSFMQIDK